MRTSGVLLWLPVVLALGADAARADKPKDCSTGAIPDTPATLAIGTEKIPLPFAEMVLAGSMSSGDDSPKYITWRLELHDSANLFAPVEVDFTVLIKEGETFDGKLFRRVPSEEISDQPSPESGMPEVQGWSVEHEDRGLDVNHVLVVASLRLELGKRAGDVIPGKVRLCVPGAQKQKIGSDVVADAIEVVGTFQAKVKQ
jgi:hypothetical protein